MAVEVERGRYTALLVVEPCREAGADTALVERGISRDAPTEVVVLSLLHHDVQHTGIALRLILGWWGGEYLYFGDVGLAVGAEQAREGFARETYALVVDEDDGLTTPDDGDAVVGDVEPRGALEDVEGILRPSADLLGVEDEAVCLTGDDGAAATHLDATELLGLFAEEELAEVKSSGREGDGLVLTLVAKSAKLEEVGASRGREGEGAEGVGHDTRDEGAVGEPTQ